MRERFDQKTARAARRVENRFAELGIGDLDHESHDRPRRVELAGIARRIAHLAQHRFVERAECVQLLARSEMNAVDLVDHIAQQIAVDHAVDRALEHGRDHVAAIAALASDQAPQIGEEPGPARAIGPDRFFVVHERDQFIAGDAVRFAAQSRQRYGGSIAGRNSFPRAPLLPRAEVPGHRGTSGT